MTNSAWTSIAIGAILLGGSIGFLYWYNKQLKAGRSLSDIKAQVLGWMKDAPKDIKSELAACAKKAGLEISDKELDAALKEVK